MGDILYLGWCQQLLASWGGGLELHELLQCEQQRQRQQQRQQRHQQQWRVPPTLVIKVTMYKSEKVEIMRRRI